MKRFKRLSFWIKANKWYLLSYIIVVVISIILSNVYLEDEINNSQKEIQNELDYGVFSNKKSFGTRNESYTIVSYAKAEVPKLNEQADSSAYNQQYGGLKNYFKASDGWEIKLFKKNGTSITEIHITPYAAGYFSESNSNPESLFRHTYNNIIKDEDYNIDVNNEFKVSKLTSLNSKFHQIQSNPLKTDDGLMWYDYYNGKGFVKLESFCSYYIEENQSEITKCRVLYSIGSVVFFTIIFFFIVKYHKRKRKSNFNLEISLNKSSENIEMTSDVFEDLKTKLNPSNFMNPYNPDKVKIANDLYSALLNSKGNETIISMIREKAMSELGIR